MKLGEKDTSQLWACTLGGTQKLSGEGPGTPGPLSCSLSPTLPLSQLTGDLESPLPGNMQLWTAQEDSVWPLLLGGCLKSIWVLLFTEILFPYFVVSASEIWEWEVVNCSYCWTDQLSIQEETLLQQSVPLLETLNLGKYECSDPSSHWLLVERLSCQQNSTLFS